MKSEGKFPYQEYLVYGPYVRKNGRAYITLASERENKGIVGTRTVSYARYLYETTFKVRLTSTQHVDHMDNNLSNDTISNLQVLSAAENIKKQHVHLGNNLHKSEIYTCEKCLGTFSTSSTASKYCSVKCSSDAQRKVKWPNSGELHDLVWNKPTEEVGKLYGVSGKAVEKWCKQLNVNKPPRGYWQKRKAAYFSHDEKEQ